MKWLTLYRKFSARFRRDGQSLEIYAKWYKLGWRSQSFSGGYTLEKPLLAPATSFNRSRMSYL